MLPSHYVTPHFLSILPLRSFARLSPFPNNLLSRRCLQRWNTNPGLQPRRRGKHLFMLLVTYFFLPFSACSCPHISSFFWFVVLIVCCLPPTPLPFHSFPHLYYLCPSHYFSLFPFVCLFACFFFFVVLFTFCDIVWWPVSVDDVGLHRCSAHSYVSC